MCCCLLQIISPTTLFLAAKVEEQPRKLEHVIKVAHACLNPQESPLDTKSNVSAGILGYCKVGSCFFFSLPVFPLWSWFHLCINGFATFCCHI